MSYDILREVKESMDVDAIIQQLKNTDFSKDNASQGKMVQLLRGLAFSDNPKATEFINKLNVYITNM